MYFYHKVDCATIEVATDFPLTKGAWVRPQANPWSNSGEKFCIT
jgi:hypothetical protein